MLWNREKTSKFFWRGIKNSLRCHSQFPLTEWSIVRKLAVFWRYSEITAFILSPKRTDYPKHMSLITSAGWQHRADSVELLQGLTRISKTYPQTYVIGMSPSQRCCLELPVTLSCSLSLRLAIWTNMTFSPHTSIETIWAQELRRACFIFVFGTEMN